MDNPPRPEATCGGLLSACTRQKRQQLDAGTMDGIGWESRTQYYLGAITCAILGGGRGKKKALRTPSSEVARRRVGEGGWFTVSVCFVLLDGLPSCLDPSRPQEAQAQTWLGGFSRWRKRMGLGSLMAVAAGNLVRLTTKTLRLCTNDLSFSAHLAVVTAPKMQYGGGASERCSQYVWEDQKQGGPTILTYFCLP